MIIRGAHAYVDGKFSKTDILIEDGRITKVAKGIPARGEDAVDANGLVAFPGLIETHAHLREPGQEQKEDFLSGSKAALAGGYTLVYDMPNNLPTPTATKAALEKKRELAKKALCEIRFHFAATDTNFADVREANPESLKMYLGKTTGSIVLGWEAALTHMMEFPKDKQVIIHAHGEGRDLDADVKGVKMAVSLARQTKRKAHLTHISTKRELDAAKSYRLATADITPHHLFLSKEDGERMKPKENALVNPPLRPKKEVALLWGSLEKIDAVATDHAPHLPEEKKQGAHGFPGMETALALFLDAYNRRKISLEWIAQRFSENPARIMGLKDYGKIARGCVGNITLVSVKKEWRAKGSEMHSKAGWTPFEGKKLKGKVVKTIYKGKVAFSDLH